MRFSEEVRKKIFFFIDSIKDGSLKKSIIELQQFELYNSTEKTSYIIQKWKNLQKDITTNVDYYINYSNTINLKDFPVINKKMIAENITSFYNKNYDIKNLIPVRTSGSYGTPITYYLTPFKKKKQQAEVVFFGRKAGYDIGIKHGYFRSEATKKSTIKLWLQNQTLFASKEFSASFLKTGVYNLKSKKIKTLIGFPSSISYLAKNCIDSNYSPSDFNVTGIITQSENLTKYHRDIMHKAFNCVVHNRYSTEELGVLGNEFIFDEGFEINCCNYIVEILKLDSNQSVNKGELGRVVVTDLHSNAMPLIRYETGDLAILGEFIDKEQHWVGKFSKLSGRTIQIIFSTNGVPLYPLYLDSIMDPLDCFAQYQLIQHDAITYELKLVKNTNYNESSFNLDDLKNQFYNWLGKDAELKIDFVEDIERLPSGKRPYIINKFKEFKI